MDPDVMLCTTAFVKAETCLDDYMETAVLTTKSPQNKDYYSPEKGRDTTDADREGWVGIAAAAAPAVASGDENSIVNLCKRCECVVCSCVNHSNGEMNMGFENKLLLFWVILGATIAINIVFEILLLMYVAMQYAVKVAWALDIRLLPLNADRAFVADSLVRAAFELGVSCTEHAHV